MATNPNPARITDELWWLWEQLHLLEPTSQLGGIYADKPGYHNTRAANAPDDYSVREPEDQGGPDDKSAAIDWTFPEAPGGDYRRMDLYGEHLQRAWETLDPRMAGWFEALGQTDLDATPEGLCFRHHTTRTPDSSHAWHWHFSCDRRWVANLDNMKALLSVLRGETLAQYQAAGGRLLEGTEMELTDIVKFVQAADVKYSAPQTTVAGILASTNYYVLQSRNLAATAATEMRSKVEGLTTIVQTLADALKAGGTDVDTAAVLARIDQRAVEDVQRDAAQRAEVDALQAEVDHLRTALAAAAHASADALQAAE